jgi:hypothetical protein
MVIQKQFWGIYAFLFVFGHLICSKKPFRYLKLHRETARGVQSIPDWKNRSG